MVEKHAQGGNDFLCTKPMQELSLFSVADTNDTKPGCMPRGHTGSAVREGDCLLWLDAEAAAGNHQKVGGGAGAQAFGADVFGVDAFLDQAREVCELEHRQRAGARGDHRASEAGMPGRLEVATRSGEGGHSMLPQPS